MSHNHIFWNHQVRVLESAKCRADWIRLLTAGARADATDFDRMNFEDYRRATFGAKSGLVHNTIMEAAQRVRYPIERWPNEFAREDAPYQWNWDKYDRIPGLSMAQVHWIIDSDPNNGGDSKQKNDPLILNESVMKQK